MLSVPELLQRGHYLAFEKDALGVLGWPSQQSIKLLIFRLLDFKGHVGHEAYFKKKKRKKRKIPFLC